MPTEKSDDGSTASTESTVSDVDDVHDNEDGFVELDSEAGHAQRIIKTTQLCRKEARRGLLGSGRCLHPAQYP